MFLITLSLLANIMITLIVTFVIWRDHPAASEVYGPDCPARRILGCVYLTIGIVSLYALAQLGLGQASISWHIAQVLLPVQIIYKVMTAIALRPLHPVVLANLALAGLHGVTLMVG